MYLGFFFYESEYDVLKFNYKDGISENLMNMFLFYIIIFKKLFFIFFECRIKREFYVF